VGKQVELLKHHTDLAARLGLAGKMRADLDPIDPDLALVMHFELAQASDQGGFARSRRAAYDDLLAAGHRQIHLVEGLESAKRLAHALDLDQRGLQNLRLAHGKHLCH